MNAQALKPNRSGTYARLASERPAAMPTSDLRTAIVGRLLEQIASLPDADLLRLFEESVKPTSEPPPPMQVQEQDVTTSISTSPGSVLAITYRAVEMAKGRVINLREVFTLVKRTKPGVKRNTVQTALSRLARAGRIKHVGPDRSGDYTWVE